MYLIALTWLLVTRIRKKWTLLFPTRARSKGRSSLYGSGETNSAGWWVRWGDSLHPPTSRICYFSHLLSTHLWDLRYILICYGEPVQVQRNRVAFSVMESRFWVEPRLCGQRDWRVWRSSMGCTVSWRPEGQSVWRASLNLVSLKHQDEVKV